MDRDSVPLLLCQLISASTNSSSVVVRHERCSSFKSDIFFSVDWGITESRSNVKNRDVFFLSWMS